MDKLHRDRRKNLTDPAELVQSGQLLKVRVGGSFLVVIHFSAFICGNSFESACLTRLLAMKQGFDLMLVTAGGKGAVLHAPAKLNLYFELLARCRDGYHDMETLMVPVSLYDTLFLKAIPSVRAAEPGEIDFEFHWCGRAGRGPCSAVPADETNLVVRALELLRQKSGSTAGAQVRLLKRIPTQAGLGGGSSDAAAALLAANRVWGIGWSRDRLAEIACALGSDVPFFLWQTPAIVRGRGERLSPLRQIGDMHAVIVHPPEGLSTASVYAASRVPETPQQIESLLSALQSGSLGLIKRALHNRLQEAANQLSPWIHRLRDEFESVHCLAHQMTGSGSSYFGICHHARHAKQIAARLRGRNLGQVFTVRRAF